MTMADTEPTAVDLVVTEKDELAEGVLALTIRHPEGERLTDWAPGAHIDLLLPNGMTRQYSLCDNRWDAYSYRIAILREPLSRGGSTYIHDQLRVGDRISIGGPRNNFRLVPASRYRFIAGGIGITPLLPMLRQAEFLGVPWDLAYLGRSRSTMAFLDELDLYGSKVTVVARDEGDFFDLATWLPGSATDMTVYCCGPERLLTAVEQRGVDYPTGRLRTERFVPKRQDAPARTGPFRLELRRSGRTVDVRPGESVLQAVLGAGVGVLSSCRQGTCGTCETAVLAGEPDHRDSLLDDHERANGDCMYICVSRSLSDHLVLDL